MEQPWETGCFPHNETATGWLGEHRDSMLTNELLRKAPVGKAKIRGLKVPGPDHIYGLCNRDPWNMGHALLGWTRCLPDLGPKLPSIKKYRNTKDFRQINRSAILKGIVDAPAFRTFAKSHRAALTDPKENKMAAVAAGISERPPPAIPPVGMVHGCKNSGVADPMDPWIHLKILVCGRGLPEPMGLVLCHGYQSRWMIEKKLKEQHEKSIVAKQVTMKASKPNFQQWYPTRASMLRTVMPPIDVDSPPWRMPRFLKKAKPHLSTFPSEDVRSACIQANAFDHVGRQGTMGQGIITKAVNREAGVEATRLERGCRVCPKVTQHS